MSNLFKTPYNCGSTITDTCKNAKVPMNEQGFVQLFTEAASSGTYIIDYSIKNLKSDEYTTALITYLRNLFVAEYFVNLWYGPSIIYSASKYVGLDSTFEYYINYGYSYVCTCTEDVAILKASSH